MNKSDILTAAKWRSAIKKFNEKRKINDDDWQFLLEIARFAPSSYGFEPWNILVVQNPEMRHRLKPAIGTNAPRLTASHLVIFTVKNDLGVDSKHFRHIMTDICHDNKIVQTAVLTSFKSFQNKQQDLTDDRKRHDWAAKQAYLALANMMLAAAEIGIDSCPIEGFDKAAAEKILSDAGVLDLKTDSLAIIATFGYRAAKPHTKTRRNLDEIVRTV